MEIGDRGTHYAENGCSYLGTIVDFVYVKCPLVQLDQSKFQREFRAKYGLPDPEPITLLPDDFELEE